MRKYIPTDAHLIPEQAQKVFTGAIYQVYQWSQELYDGTTTTFEMLSRADTVKIIALLSSEELKALKDIKCEQIDHEMGIIITKQKQPGKDWFYDFPGGRADPEDADELMAAKRELKEETGLEFKNWKLFDVHQPFNKIDWLVYTFITTGLSGQTAQSLDGGEMIEVEAVSLEELKTLSNEPDSQYLRFKNYDQIQNVAELLERPSLYQY